MSVRILHADSRDALREMDDASVDSCVCDPPYALVSIVKRFGGANAAPAKDRDGLYKRASAGFMGKQWDTGDTAFDPAFWVEVLRVLKPGGHIAAMGGDRTFHRLVCAIEDAGAEIRGTLAYLYGSGFPKSRNVGRELSSLPWCSCGGAAVASARTVEPVPTAKRSATVDALTDIFGTDASCGFRADIDEDASAPLELVGASHGAEAILGPSHGLAADAASGFGDKANGGARHRSLNVATAAERQEIVDGVGSVQIQPEALRHEMMGDQPVSRATIGAEAISCNGATCNLAPTPAFVGPSTAAPSGVLVAGEALPVVNGHACAGAIDGALAGDGPGSLAQAITNDTLNNFGRHAEQISKMIDAGQINVCSVCAQPNAPPWVYEGAGTALKPAMELICLARKPLLGTVAANVLKHGTGALNIDASRIETDWLTERGETWLRSGNDKKSHDRPAQVPDNKAGSSVADRVSSLGRWPANVILSYPADEYALRSDVSAEQKRELFRWLHENA